MKSLILALAISVGAGWTIPRAVPAANAQETRSASKILPLNVKERALLARFEACRWVYQLIQRNENGTNTEEREAESWEAAMKEITDLGFPGAEANHDVHLETQRVMTLRIITLGSGTLCTDSIVSRGAKFVAARTLVVDGDSAD